MMLGLANTIGSPVAPNCFAGEKVTTFADGSFGCSSGVTDQSIGIAAPDCGGGSPYLDDMGEWQCSAPPAPQSSGGAGVFLVAAALAAGAYFYFANKAQKTYQKIASGDPQQLLSAAGVDL